MKVAIPRERRAGERRVAATPETVKSLRQLGFDVVIESAAGAGAAFGDDDYRQAGARIESDTRRLWGDADVVLKVNPPDEYTDLGTHEIDLMRPGALLIS